jgi:hypothetical protein
VNGREEVLEDGGHELELLVLATEAGEDELCVARTMGRRRNESQQSLPSLQKKRKKRTRGASANSLPMALGLLAILNTSIASEYLSTLKLSVGPRGNLINLKLTVVVPSIRVLSALSSADSPGRASEFFLPFLPFAAGAASGSSEARAAEAFMSEEG